MTLRPCLSIGLLAAVLSTSGCFTAVNTHLISKADKPKTRQVMTQVRLEEVSAFRQAEDLIRVGVSYADGHSDWLRWRLSGANTEWTQSGWPSPNGVALPIAKGTTAPPQDGLCLEGDRLVLYEAGRERAMLPLARQTKSREAIEPNAGQRLWSAAKKLFFVLTLPVAVGVDACTWPLQLGGVLIYVKTGGSLLIFG